MPKRSKGRNQREDWNLREDWIEDDAESSNGPDSGNNSNGIMGRNGEGNQNDRGGRGDRRGMNYQSSHAIEPVTQAARRTGDILSQALEEVEKFRNLCTKYVDDIEEVDSIHQKYRELQEQCKEKDMKITQHNAVVSSWGDAINDIKERGRKEMSDKEEEFRKQFALVEEGKKALEKLKKTFKAEKAERQHELDEELKKRKEEQDKEFKTHWENSEKGIKQREDANENKLKDLEANNKKLSESLTGKEERIGELEGKAKRIKERYEEQIRLKNSFKEEKEALEKKLAVIENEFGMTSQTMDFYQEKFAEISKLVEEISFQYFSELSEEMIIESEEIRKILIEADGCFASIPISLTDVSRNLRIAHAQRIISSSLCDNIFQTFSSEKILSHRQSASLLSEIDSAFSKTCHTRSGRGESVWRTLTIRALRSLQPDSPTSLTSISHGSSPAPSIRANQVLHDIFAKLSPLIIPTREQQLREDLLKLAQAAIFVWTLAQTDKVKLVVSLTLNPAEPSKWRSVYDSSSSDDNHSQVDIISSTHPQIFTLFPRVIAQTLSEAAEPSQNLPGNWPESQQEPHMIEFDVHSGIGLRDCSDLVVNGKAELVETKIYLKKVNMDYKTRRSTNGSISISRRSSMIEPPSGPPSPSALWESVRGRKVIKE